MLVTDSDAPFKAFMRAIGIAGGQAPFARMVGCTQGAIWQRIKKRRPIGDKYVLKAEAGTGVSRHDLRPDLYPRESAAGAGGLEVAR